MNSIIQNIRTKLFAGIATALPLLFTYFLLEFLFVSLDELSAPILEKFGIEIPGLGIVLTLEIMVILEFVVMPIVILKIKVLKKLQIKGLKNQMQSMS